MGLIRGGLVTLCSIALFLVFLIAAVFLTVSMSLSYNSLKSEIQDSLIEVVVGEENVSEALDYFLDPVAFSFCEKAIEIEDLEEIGLEEINLEDLGYLNLSELDDLNLSLEVDEEESKVYFTQVILGYSVDIPCDLIVEEDNEKLLEYILGDLVKQNYNKEYDCKFMDCFSKEKTPMFVFSKHSKNYFQSKFYLFLAISLVLAVLLFFLTETKNSYPFILGILFLIVSFPILLLSRLIPIFHKWRYFNILGVFFSQSFSVFLILLVLGIVSICIGILLKFLAFGRFISGIFKKDDKISKEDIKKEVKESIREEKDSKKSKKGN